MKILFVCTGNMCRSPFAEAYCRAQLAKKGEILDAVDVWSAGTMTDNGGPAAGEAVTQAAGGWDVDMAGHKTSRLSEEIIDDSDLVLVMDRSHHDMIRTFWHHHLEKVHYLSEYNPDKPGRKKDISDPYGRSDRHYRKSFQRIIDAVDGLVESLVRGGNVQE